LWQQHFVNGVGIPAFQACNFATLWIIKERQSQKNLPNLLCVEQRNRLSIETASSTLNKTNYELSLL